MRIPEETDPTHALMWMMGLWTERISADVEGADVSGVEKLQASSSMVARRVGAYDLAALSRAVRTARDQSHPEGERELRSSVDEINDGRRSV